jgi:hypothetical protein
MLQERVIASIVKPDDARQDNLHTTVSLELR